MPKLILADLIKRFRDKFSVKIQVKTGWGKNQVMIEFDLAMAELLAEIADEAIAANESQLIS